MEQLKLSNGSAYDLVTNGVQETEDSVTLVFLPGLKTFADIEKDFESEANTGKMYVLDSAGNAMRSIVGFTQYKGMEKILEYTVSSEVIGEESKEVKETVFKVHLTKPDIQKQVQDIQDTVDMLVAEQLGE